MRASICLVLIACSGVVGCSTMQIQGRVVNCANNAPLEGVGLRVLEAGANPNEARSTSNYYYATTKKDGTFSVAVASSDPAPWQAQATKVGFQEAAVRYEIGVKAQNMCMKAR